MKKLFYGIVLALTFTACNKEIGQHQIAVLHPSFNGLAPVYADHTQDSIALMTYDSYRCNVREGDDWFTLDPKMKELEVKYSMYSRYIFVIYADMEVNTTCAARRAQVDINNYGEDWNQTVQTGFIQYGWLNVSRPEPSYLTSEDNQRRALFELKDSATQVSDSIFFCTERAWTLTSKQNLVTMDKTSGAGGDEVVKVRLTLTPNQTAEERIDTLLLQSSGVTTPIYVRQASARKEE